MGISFTGSWRQIARDGRATGRPRMARGGGRAPAGGPPGLAGPFLLMVLHILPTLPLGDFLPQCQPQTVIEPLLYLQPVPGTPVEISIRYQLYQGGCGSKTLNPRLHASTRWISQSSLEPKKQINQNSQNTNSLWEVHQQAKFILSREEPMGGKVIKKKRGKIIRNYYLRLVTCKTGTGPQLCGGSPEGLLRS